MKRLSILAIVAVIFASFAGFGVGSHKHAPPSAVSSAAESSLLDRINQVRSEHKLAPLREDPVLDQTAKVKAEDMAARNYWDHTNPDGTPFYFLLQQKRPGLRYYGENLAECFTSNAATVDAWVKSPGHLENIVRPTYTIFGSYSVWDQDKNCLITVNHFGEEQ